MNAAATRIQLNGEKIDVVEAAKASGTDTQPARKLDFAADQLTVRFTPESEVSRIEGVGASKLVSTSKGGATTVTSNRVDLDFMPSPKGSLLSKALATGQAPNRIYNIGNRQPIDPMRYIAVLEDCLGKKAVKNLLPMQPGDAPDTWADVEDLVIDVGYLPETSIEEGVRNFVDWYLINYRR